jgi:Protein of unknown function (DUF4245)
MEGVSAPTGPQPPSPAPDVPPEPSTPSPPARGTRGTVADMIRTMLVVLAAVAVIWALVPRPDRVVQPSADVAGAAAAASEQLGFTPLIPQGLPAGWLPTEAAVRTAADGIKEFHIGYTSSQGQAGVEQATRLTQRWLEINDSGGRTTGSIVIDGLRWAELDTAERQQTSLLLSRTNQVILVTSKNGGLAQARLLAEALHVPAS